MQIVDIITQTFRIVGLSSSYFRRYPSLLLFPLFSLLIYILLEAAVLLFMYERYGILIFNPESLEMWSFVSLWELGLIFAFFIAPLYCFLTIFIMISKASLAHAIVSLLETGSFSIKKSFMRSIGCKYELAKYAYLRTILIIIGETGLKRFLHKHVQELGGSDFIYTAKEDNWFEATFLVIPVLVMDYISLQKAIKKSCTLMQETFGGSVSALFSFVAIIVCVSFFIGSPLAHIVTKDVNGLVGISLFFLLIGVIMCSMRGLEGVFHAIVYQFCLQRPTGNFSREDILKSFIKENYDLNDH